MKLVLTGGRSVYVDFTDGYGIGSAHDLFLGVQDNPNVMDFCHRVLHGQRGEVVPGFRFDERVNAFRLRI